MQYKINGYNLLLLLGFTAHEDRTTADGFEKPAGTMEAEKYQWAEGILEYDLLSPVLLKPRVFTLKGKMAFENQSSYLATKIVLTGCLYQPYVTLEAVEVGVKANARLQPDGITWHRMTNLDGKIVVDVQFTFDEILQPVPFKTDGEFFFNVDENMDLISTVAPGSLFQFSLNSRKQLILTQ